MALLDDVDTPAPTSTAALPTKRPVGRPKKPVVGQQTADIRKWMKPRQPTASSASVDGEEAGVAEVTVVA